MSTELTTTSQLTAMALAAFDESRKAVEAVKDLTAITVAKDGIGKVTASRVQVKKLRVSIDKRREEQNSAALEHQRAVNALAKGLIAEVRQVEDYLAGEEAAHEAAKEAARQAKEAARMAALQFRIDRLTAAGALDICVHEFEGLSEASFEKYVSQAAEMARVRAEEEQREAERVAAAEAEERIRAEQERAERDRLEKERAAEMAHQAEELRIRNAEIDRERRELEAEKDELRRQQEQARLEEQARQDLIALIERDREREAKRLEEAARLEALRPEIERAEKFTADVMNYASGMLGAMGSPVWAEMAEMAIESACTHIRNSISAKGGAT